jgi:hypothetical protein
MATTEPEQVCMQAVQLPELQLRSYDPSFGQFETFPVGGVREGVPERLEDIDSVVPPDLQIN